MKTKTLLLVFLLGLIHSGISGQFYYQDFDQIDNPDVVPIVIDSSSTLWQIGVPQKNLFDAAYSPVNALVTDTLLPYPVSDTARFYITLPLTEEIYWSYYWSNVAAVKWMQKLDIDSLDGGMVEFSIDQGVSWENAFTSAYTYNYYGYEFDNVGELSDGNLAFSGSDNTWREVWLCFQFGWLFESTDTLRLRYSFISDSIPGTSEGWMIDNFTIEPTFVHTVEKSDAPNYMTIYPNPTNDKIHIAVKNVPGYHIIKSIELVSEQGVVVKRYGISPTKFFIDVSDIHPGKYLLNITTNLSTEVHRVIIVD